MKKLIAVMLLSILSASVFAEKQKTGVVYDATLTRVIDGDTVAFKADWLPDPLKKELSIRVFGVDTPEKGFRAKCQSESERGMSASEFTKNAVKNSRKRQVLLMDWDKYGGRVLGDVILDGQSLRMMLIQNGYAREYYGEAKQSWCKI